jgi:hypothetical protein
MAAKKKNKEAPVFGNLGPTKWGHGAEDRPTRQTVRAAERAARGGGDAPLTDDPILAALLADAARNTTVPLDAAGFAASHGGIEEPVDIDVLATTRR